MDNKVSIRDLIKESDVQMLTNETFAEDRKEKSLIKRLVLMAACVALVFGIFNYNAVYGSVKNLLTYVIGIGIQSSDSLDYYTMNSPIKLGPGDDSIKIEYVYRNNDSIIVLIESKGNSDVKCNLIIDGIRYKPGSGIASVPTTASSDEVSNRKEEFIFENVKKSNNFILEINDSYEANIELSKPNPITYMVNQNINDYELTVIPLSSDNSKVGIDIKPMKNTNKILEYNIRDLYFIDEHGNRYLGKQVGLSGNEFQPFEKPEGKIIRIEGGTIVCAVSREKVYNYIEKFKLPNPKINESISVNKVVRIKDLPDVIITQIARDENGLLSVTREIGTDEYSSWSFDISIINESNDTTTTNGIGNIKTTLFENDRSSGENINFGVYNFEVYSSEEWLIDLD